MVMCEECTNEDCSNAFFDKKEGLCGVNTAEFCVPMIELVKKKAKTHVSNAKIPSENIERHLRTIQNARDFWHPEDLFNEGDREPDGEGVSEDEAEFWTIFDEIVDRVFAG
jgi:hypothetical protein